jgi:hypothetical protein
MFRTNFYQIFTLKLNIGACKCYFPRDSPTVTPFICEKMLPFAKPILGPLCSSGFEPRG